VSKPTIADLPERYRLQIARQLAQAKRPTTISREPDPAPEPKIKREFDRAQVFLRALRVREVPIPECEWKFDTKRRWRFDYAWPQQMIALEVEGGVWTVRVTPDKLVSAGTFEMIGQIFSLPQEQEKTT